MNKRFYVLSTIFTLSILFLSGCLFKGEQSLEEMDPPPNVQVTDNLDNVGNVDAGTDTEADDQQQVEEDGEALDGESDSSAATTQNRELYLIDENGMVVPQTLPLPSSDSNAVAKQVLQYLVKDGPVTNLLPNGFQAVLPAGTEINSLNLQDDGTLIVDLSEEFKEYEPEEELQIIQAMTFTLTQFDSVERLKLRIDGVEQNVMPVNGTPISNGYSRADGINIYVGDVGDITEAEATTLYFPAQHDTNFYYVPVTMPIEANDYEIYSVIVDSLIDGPGYELTGLLNVFDNEAEMISEPTMEEGVLTLTFNQSIFSDSETQTISNEVMSSLVLTLTEQEGIESVQVKVEGVEQVFNENGEVLSEPVSREDITKASSI